MRWVAGGALTLALVAGCSNANDPAEPPDPATRDVTAVCDPTYPPDWSDPADGDRTANLVIVNCSSTALQYDAQWNWSIDHGELSSQSSDWEQRADELSGNLAADTGKALVKTESDGLLTGVQGTGYLGQEQNLEKTLVQLEYDVPYDGGNSFGCSASDPTELSCSVTSTGDDHAVAVYVIEDAG